MIEANYRSVYIPPLNLSPKIKPSHLLGKILSNKGSNQNQPRNSVDLLKHNSSFVKEKSLYRCYISKNKVSESQEKMSQVKKSLGKTTKQENSKQDLERCYSIKGLNKYEEQLNEQAKQNELNKQKYFKRKSRQNRTNVSQIRLKTEQNSINNEEQFQKSLIDLLKEQNDVPSLKESSSMNFQDLAIKQTQIAQLKQHNLLIARENSRLKQKLFEKQEKIKLMSDKILSLQTQKKQLESKLQIAIEKISLNIKEETQLANQLQLKEKVIHKLETGYKYIEIENTVLNKAKAQCSLQTSIIVHLQRQKKILEEKVRLLYQADKKKKGLKSKLRQREYSQLSLSLSMQKEQKQIDDLSPTADRTLYRNRQQRNQTSERMYS